MSFRLLRSGGEIKIVQIPCHSCIVLSGNLPMPFPLDSCFHMNDR